jgi:hypothetical protein
MAKEKFNRKLPSLLSAGKKTPKSRFLVLVGFIFIAAVAGSLVAVGAGIRQRYFRENPSGDGVFAAEIRCNVLNAVVVVHAPDHADILIACEGARDAIVFLTSQGLDAPIDIAIDLVARLPAVVSASATGFCLESERRAIVLVYSEFRKFKTWFGVPIKRALYRSLVSHEVAHLVAGYNFKIPKPSIQAKEYIAYITQFATMEPVLRERVLARFPLEGFEGDWQMKSTIYMLDCMSFGVRAYRHFLKPANGRDYLHKILTGKALVE